MVTELCYVGAGIGNQPVTRVLTVLTLIQHGARSARSVFSNHQHEISFTAASAQPSISISASSGMNGSAAAAAATAQLNASQLSSASFRFLFTGALRAVSSLFPS